ncbi:hypothetical protein V1478_001146 [Vespula squamosa]|uniref:Uncharacterized protein n=1 Tax=Vespula squamosa TaxID=30214 RepID=A0ABD2C7J3_VESSQ
MEYALIRIMPLRMDPQSREETIREKKLNTLNYKIEAIPAIKWTVIRINIPTSQPRFNVSSKTNSQAHG